MPVFYHSSKDNPIPGALSQWPTSRTVTLKLLEHCIHACIAFCSANSAFLRDLSLQHIPSDKGLPIPLLVWITPKAAHLRSNCRMAVSDIGIGRFALSKLLVTCPGVIDCSIDCYSCMSELFEKSAQSTLPAGMLLRCDSAFRCSFLSCAFQSNAFLFASKEAQLLWPCKVRFAIVAPVRLLAVLVAD